MSKLTKDTIAKLNVILKKNEQSVFLKDIRDAKKSSKEDIAQQAIKNYNSWKRS